MYPAYNNCKYIPPREEPYFESKIDKLPDKTASKKSQ
jgi:hypothetical protein